MMIDLQKYYGLKNNLSTIKPFGSGLINYTWIVNAAEGKFILQSINTNVFKNPFAIDENIMLIKKYLNENYPGYLLPTPIETITGKTLVEEEGKYFRLIPFLNGSVTYSVLQNPEQSFEAAKQFGKFTKLLSDFDASQLQTTIPQFHDLNFRWQQFEYSLQNAYRQRLLQAGSLIDKLNAHKNIVDAYNAIIQNKNFKQRVTHHDTKISNVLFDNEEKAICVIDLDTIMPGYFFSDVGDMMRTYLSAAGEEETDMSKVFVRPEYFKAILDGYLSEMSNELSDDEKNAFTFAGKFMIYMQALRFIADFLTGDTYYGAKYPLHNLNRATNQITLLHSLIKQNF